VLEAGYVVIKTHNFYHKFTVVYDNLFLYTQAEYWIVCTCMLPVLKRITILLSTVSVDHSRP